MNDTIKPIAGFVTGALIALLILWAISPTPPEEINWSQLSEAGINAKMESATPLQVASYIGWVEAEPWPRSFVIPAYVANAQNERSASSSVNHQYPEFAGKAGEELLQSVKAHPLRYRDYIREMKSIRRIFDVRNPS